MRRSITELVLDVLQHGTETTADLFIMMTKNYADSYRYARRGMMGAPGFTFKKSWSDEYRRRQSFYSLVSKLKQDGLIEQNDSKGGAWEITKKGREKNEFYKNKNAKYRWISETEKSPKVIIVSYDVPEVFGKERQWLREILKLLDYEPVHKSVWVGTKRLPVEFFRELEGRKILNGVHVFEILKGGTLSKISRNKK